MLDAVHGDAKKVFEAFEVTNNNYKIARALLKERFENKPLIIQSHLKGLFEMPALSNESKHSLCKSLDDLQKHIRALKALGKPVDS